jgi:hypothetical protein
MSRKIEIGDSGIHPKLGPVFVQKICDCKHCEVDCSLVRVVFKKDDEPTAADTHRWEWIYPFDVAWNPK